MERGVCRCVQMSRGNAVCARAVKERIRQAPIAEIFKSGHEYIF